MEPVVLQALEAFQGEPVVLQALAAFLALVAYPVVLLVCLYLRQSFSLLHIAKCNLAIVV